MPKSKPKVLVAAVDETALATGLQAAGFDVVSARDAHQAYSVARHARPDVAVLDARIQRGGALTAVKWMRAGVHTADIPIVAIAPAQGSQARELEASGAQLCVDVASGAEAVCKAVQSLAGVVAEPPRTAPASELQDAARLAALRASGLLDSPPDAAYDRLARLAAKLLSTPVALLSLVDKDRQFFKSQIGLAAPWSTQRQTPLSHSFCQWVVAGREQVTVEDARVHPVLRNNAAIRDLGVVAYAGVPVRGAEGQVLGSMCTIDAKPRTWSPKELEHLRDLTFLAEAFIAQAALSRQPPRQPTDFDRYVGSCGDAIAAAVRVLRREPSMAPEDREVLLAEIERYAGNLVQLNRMIQVARALA